MISNNNINSADMPRLEPSLLFHATFIQHLNIIALALLAVSVLYLLAANWWMIPTAIQLALPQLIFIIATCASFYFSKTEKLVQTLHSICGLMIGLSLAVIGQVYQTGADSYLLFLVWALLLLPWLYRPNIGVFTIWVIVSHLALLLYFEQTFWLERAPQLLTVSLNLWSLFSFALCLFFYPKLRYLFLFWFTVVALWSMVAFSIKSDVFLFLSGVFLPSIAFFYFYKKHDTFCSSISAAILGLSLTIWLASQVIDFFGHEAASLIVLSIFALLWFGIISAGLMKLFPTSRFNAVPMAIGAWLSGLLLASFILVMWESISMIFGVLFLFAGAYLLKFKQNTFLKHFGYCLLISGQSAFLTHLGILTEQFYLLAIAQFVLCGGLYLLKPHWLFKWLQLITLYAIILFCLFYYVSGHSQLSDLTLVNLLNIITFIPLLFLNKLDSGNQKACLLLILSSILTQAFFQFFGRTTADAVLHIQQPMVLLGLVIWLALLIWWVLKPQLSIVPLICISLLGLALIIYGRADIFVLIVLLGYVLQLKHMFLYGLTLAVLAFVLWFFYYSMHINFLSKSLMIFISGMIVLGIYAVLNHQITRRLS